MAIKPVIIVFGNSEFDAPAVSNAVDAADYLRWTGTTYPTTTPVDIEVPGIYMLSARLPYGTRDVRNITASGVGSVSFDGTVLAATQVDQWGYVKSGTTGVGQHFKITAGTGTDTASVTGLYAWTPPSTDGTIEFWTTSHTCDAGSTTTSFVKTATTGGFTSGDVGKWIVVISGAGLGGSAMIESVDSATTVTLDRAVTTAPSAGDGICILSGTGGIQTIADYTSANVTWKPLRFYYDFCFTYATGYDYNNFRAAPQLSPASDYSALSPVNIVPELTWQIRNARPENLYCIQLAFPSSYISPYNGELPFTKFSWARGDLHNDWHPSSQNDLMSVLTQAITIGFDQIVADGDTPEVIGIFTTPGELESFIEARKDKFGINARLIRDYLRDFIAAGGWCKQDAKKIPWIMSGTASSTWIYRDEINDEMQLVANEDDYSGYVDTTDMTFVDDVHYDITSCVTVAQRLFSEWDRIRKNATSASTPDGDRYTLSQIRDKVRRRYERNISSNDDTNAQVDNFINDSLREIYNTLGDNAWFIRRVETISLDTQYPGTLLLPRNVKRLIKIENESFPGRDVKYKGIAYKDNSRIQLTLHDYSGGPYVCHYIARHVDLDGDDDKCLIPMDYMELVVMLTCKRLAETAGNMSMIQYYGAENERLWKYVKRDVLRFDRMRQGQMTVIDSFDSWRNGSSTDFLGNL